jgi:DNA-binding CsgD family transcriptional regulator
LASDRVEGTFAAFEKCVHPDDRASLHSAIERSLLANEEFHHEYRVVWPDGSEHWIEARGKVFTDDLGRPVRQMGTIMNISHRKLAEKLARIRDSELTRLAKANLTPREFALLKLIAAGLPNKRIAIDLNISVKTVAKHRAHLMAKTQALNAADLARMSALAGVLSVA